MSDTAISRKAVLLECLHRRVLTQELGPAGNLDEARLSDEFCLSRAALRELAGESYVELLRKRSARVSEMNDTMLSDFFSCGTDDLWRCSAPCRDTCKHRAN